MLDLGAHERLIWSRSARSSTRLVAPGHEARVRSGDHQHRQQRRAAVLQRDPPRREPQITLRGIPRRPGQPVRRIRPPVLWPQPRQFLPKPRRRPVPADPLSDHRCRQIRESASSAATHGPDGENDVGTGLRSYFGGTSEATARATVDLPIPANERPAAAEPRQPLAAGSAPNPPLRSPSQSVWVASFSSGTMASFPSGADSADEHGRDVRRIPVHDSEDAGHAAGEHPDRRGPPGMRAVSWGCGPGLAAPSAGPAPSPGPGR
jgi:hypothetical protein